MPRIPGPSDVSKTQGQRLPGLHDAGAPGRAFQQLGEIANQLYERRRKAEDAGFMANLAGNAEPEFTRVFEENKLKAQESGNTFVSDLNKALDQASNNLFDSSRQQGFRPSAEATQQAKFRLANLKASYLTKGVTYENNIRVEKLSNEVSGAIDRLAVDAYLNPETVDQKLFDGQALLDESSSLFPEDVWQQKTKEARESISLSAIQGVIAKDPEKAIAMLSQEGGIKNIPAEKHILLMARAVEQVEANERVSALNESKKLKIEEQALKKLNDETAKDGDKLLGTGELTAGWIEENRDKLDQDDYRYYYTQLRTESAGVTDVYIYSDLRQRASEGEDVSEEARINLRSGKLKLDDYNTLINRSEKNAPGVSIPNWFKRGEEHIKLTLQVSDLNPDPAGAQRQADALDAWNEWSNNNPKATGQDARQQYLRIAKEFAFIGNDTFILTGRFPRFAVGNRHEMDIQATEQATAEAYRRGDLTLEDLEEQVKLLKKWRESIEKSRLTKEIK